MQQILALLTTLLLATTALAQTTPELFIFKPGTAIKADEMNANFQLLIDHVTNALGLADLTSEDLEELASLVGQLQILAASGELDGASLEYEWDGTTLGVKRDNEEAFTYVDLRGAPGPQGELGPGLQFEWDGASLGVRAEGEEAFTYVDLRGATGPEGPTGDQGERGERGEPGRDGRSIQFEWDGTQLGVRYEDEAAFEYIELRGADGQQGPRGEQGERGPEGLQGIQGIQGEQGAVGSRGEPGPAGADGRDGVDGADGRGLEYDWDGTVLGIRYEGDTEYTYVDLEGPEGPEGSEGPQGIQGIQGARGEPGLPGPGLDVRWVGTVLEVKAQNETEWSRVDLKGDPGAPGATGPAGADGRTLHNGSFPPLDPIGRDGDFYIDTSTWTMYGPKDGGTWGEGASLIGPAGQDAPTYAATYGISLDDNTNTLRLDPSQHLPNCSEGERLQRYGGIWTCSPAHTYYFGATNPQGRSIADGKSIDECVLGDIWLSAARVSHGVEADGRILSINQNTALFSLLGNTYGGNGTTTFALPDLRDAAPKTRDGGAPVHYVICVQGLFPSYD